MFATISPAPVSRARHRAAVGALFFLMGLCFASWASRIPSIQQRLGLGDGALGTLLLVIPLGELATLPVAGGLVVRAGSRRVLAGGVLLYAAALLGLGWAPSRPWLLPALLLFGVAGNLTNIAVNTQAVGVERLYQGRSIMATFHGLWSLAGFAGAALGTWMLAHRVAPGAHFLLIAVLLLLGLAAATPRLLPPDPTAAADGPTPLWARPTGALLGLGALAFCALVCEGAMFDWSGVYFQKVLHADRRWVGAGYTAFMCTMALGRFGADWLTGRLGPRRVVQLSGSLTAAGLVLAVAWPAAVPATLGFLLVGLGTAAVVPLVYSAAGRSGELPAGLALTAVSSVGFLGFLLGPPLIGWVAGVSSLRVALGLVAGVALLVAYLAGRVYWPTPGSSPTKYR